MRRTIGSSPIIWSDAYKITSRSFGRTVCLRSEEEECTDTRPKERKKVCPDTVVTVKHSGMVMPALILSTWKMKHIETAQKALIKALKAGYRAIDTSPSYKNEDIVGCALPGALDEANICRKDIFLISKLPFDSMRCEKVDDALNRSLKLLNTHYVDLYVINFPAGSICCDGRYKPDPRVNHKCIWKCMEVQVEKCKAKYLGVANFNCNQVEEILKDCVIKPSNIQIELHTYFQQRSYRIAAKEFCSSVTGYAPLGMSTAVSDWLKTKGLECDVPSALSDPCIADMAKKLNKCPGQIILRYLLQLDDNLAVMIGATDPKTICDNFDIFDFSIPGTEMDALQGLDKGRSARIFNRTVFKEIFPGVEEHELFPWKDC